MRQNIVDSAVRTIEICMGADSVHAVFCQQIYRVVRPEIFYRMEYDRVVAYYKLCPGFVRSFNGIWRYIEHNGSPCDLCRAFADEQTDIVPLLMDIKQNASRAL